VRRLARVRWAEAYRIINSRYPPVDIFEHVADPSDWDTLLRIEELTNPRVREVCGEIALVPVRERPSGPGASWIMAAFTHIGRPSRFTDGSYGVYYAARAIETAIRETAYHFGRFLAATNEPRGTELELRVLVSSRVDQSFHDIRVRHPELHDPDDYRPSQAFAKPLRTSGSNGLVYNSVRHAGGTCLAVFRPKAIPCPKQGAHLRYHFDGTHVDRWFRIGEERWHPLVS
jgi:RES domain